MTDNEIMTAAGFGIIGSNEGGDVYYGRSLPDGRYVVCGDESRNAGAWGADIFPSEADYLNGDNRQAFPGIAARPADLIRGLQEAGLIG